MDIYNLVKVLINRLPILVIIAAAAAILTGATVYMGPKKYQSFAQLSTGFTVQNSFDLSDEGFNRVVSELKFNNLIEVLSSPILIETISNHLLLNDLTSQEPYSDFADELSYSWPEDEFDISRDTIIKVLQDKITNFELLSSYDSTEKKIVQIIRAHDYGSDFIRYNMSIKRANYTDYLYVNFQSGNPYLSAFVVNTLCDEFLRYNSEQRFSQSSESVEFLTSIAEQKKQILESKSNNLRKYKSRNQFLNFELESESKIKQLQEAENERNETLTKISRLNLSIELIDSKFSDDDPSSQNQEFVRLRKKLTQMNEKRRNNPNNFRALTDSISSLRNRLDQLLVTNYGGGDKTILEERESQEIELKVEEGRLASLNSRINTLRSQLSSFASTEASISFLQREVDIAGQEYLEVQKKLNDAQNASFNQNDLTKVIVRGQPALNYQSSGLLIKSALAFIAVLFFGVAFVVLIEFLDPRLKTGVRYQQVIPLKLLAVLTDTNKKESRLVILVKKVLKKSLKDPTESIMNKLRFLVQSPGDKVWLWTSFSPNAGKSYVMYELAKSLANSGKKILIIDTNFRNCHFSKIKYDKNIHWNEDVLSIEPEDQQDNEALTIFQNQLAVSNTHPQVHILQNRLPSGSPDEVLKEIDFSALVDTMFLLQEYDFIFLEGASMDEYSDAMELSKYADKAIIVFDAMAGFKLADKLLLKSLDLFKGKVFGGILNKAVA